MGIEATDAPRNDRCSDRLYAAGTDLVTADEQTYGPDREIVRS
jgi:hypothetical protein